MANNDWDYWKKPQSNFIAAAKAPRATPISRSTSNSTGYRNVP
jgi:hypothetical protein